MKYQLLSVTSGSCQTLFNRTAAGYPRIYEGQNGVYVYGMAGEFMVTRDFGTTFLNILPPGLSSVDTMEQHPVNATSGSTGIVTDFQKYTVVVGARSTSGLSQMLYYQTDPEISTWSAGTPPASPFNARHAVNDDMGYVKVLWGNAHIGNESRIVKTIGKPPWTSADSDTGIPQYPGATIAGITDLEVAE